jgi:GH35 family endo-1,4-beta-xylanase
MNVSNAILVPAALLLTAVAVCLPACAQEKSDKSGATASAASGKSTEPWPAEKANAWYAKQPWLVGSNYITSSAINQLEMWQADTFDLTAIDRELGWAESLGFTSMRVFLHHLLWEQDKAGFLNRIDQFLEVAHKYKINVMFVLFDSVWDPSPKLGKQRDPQKGLHNSGWVQSPGKEDLLDPKRQQLLEDYVKGVVGAYKSDPRISVWDIWNEPDNLNGNSYGDKHLKTELAAKVKHDAVVKLLPKTFAWAREAGATQPLTSGLWLGGHKADPAKLIPIEKVQLEQSDIISFHSYAKLDGTKTWVSRLKEYKRPILCTEYMARPEGSTFDPILAYFKEEKIAAYNWGFVDGKSNTIYPWDSWQKPYATEPPVWFHDIFRTDGKPYREEEVKYIRSVTGK